MRTKYLTFLFLLTLNSVAFGQNKDSKIDSVFKACNESKIKKEKEYLIEDYGNIVLDKTKDSTILQLFEFFLIKKNLLQDNSKKSYIELFEKIQNKEFESGLQEIFFNELGFGTYRYFFPSKLCYGNLFDLGLINESSWEYKIVSQIDKFEANGGYQNDNTKYLIKAVQTVPEKNFQKIYNRQIFLNLIFIGLSLSE